MSDLRKPVGWTDVSAKTRTLLAAEAFFGHVHCSHNVGSNTNIGVLKERCKKIDHKSIDRSSDSV